MLNERELVCQISVPIEELDKNGKISGTSIATHFLKVLSSLKSSEAFGYFLAVTKLNSIGKGLNHEAIQRISFCLSFNCRTFMPFKGEVMLGMVHAIVNHGVFLRCGPMRYIYLSAIKMPGYHFEQSEYGPAFVNVEQSRIKIGVVVRFSILGVRWIEQKWNIRREFSVLASLEGDSLGPVSLAGAEELDL